MFKPRFAALVVAGTKRQTVRPKRKRPTRPWDVLDLRQWEGLPYRSRQRKLLEAVCSMTCTINIEATGHIIQAGSFLSPGQALAFAQADGFLHTEEMIEWFKEQHGLPFRDGEAVFW